MWLWLKVEDALWSANWVIVDIVAIVGSVRHAFMWDVGHPQHMLTQLSLDRTQLIVQCANLLTNHFQLHNDARYHYKQALRANSDDADAQSALREGRKAGKEIKGEASAHLSLMVSFKFLLMLIYSKYYAWNI